MAATEYEALVLYCRRASTEGLICRLMDVGLLRREVACIHCGVRMKLRKKSANIDGFCWNCLNEECEFHSTTSGLRVGSFFSGFRASLHDIAR